MVLNLDQYGEVVSTLDIFPTILNIANDDNKNNKNMPSTLSSAILDGFDISTMLHSSCNSGPGFRNGKLIYYPQFARKDRGLFAVRSGSTKVHFHMRDLCKVDHKIQTSLVDQLQILVHQIHH